jgi:NAD(P)-dependent dehydrogenase (short-subunit alcohol dehydrogenase family)
MRTAVVTGSASGIGAATAARLKDDGHRVIGVDIQEADVVADLGTTAGRQVAIERLTELADGTIDALVACAGLPGLSDRPGSVLVSVNYFGTVVLLEGLRPLLAAGTDAAAVAVSSNSTTTQPGVPMDVVDLCLVGDEEGAREAADRAGSVAAYPATKTAVARWVRRRATTPEWIGEGITLNAVAPGAIETPMLEAGRRDPMIGGFIDAFPVPAGRKGHPDEVAAVVAFLLGPEGRFFVGSVVFVDGGTDAQLRPDDWPSPLTA